ncbi:MAG TPA: GtrA family protein [Xanthobacteraceae bacterium]|jgi:putative flippase GtrA|nr:GtrA family protein [Xanthobacteraceae bacterium]
MTEPSAANRLVTRLAQAWRERAILLKAVSFGLVGLVNLAVDFAVFSFGYFYLGLPIIVANVIAWVVAVSNSYVLNSLTTFAHESGGKLRAKDYLTFCVSQTGGLVANTTTVFVASYFMPVLLAKVLAIGAGFAVNFSLSHFVVFRARHPKARDAARPS